VYMCVCVDIHVTKDVTVKIKCYQPPSKYMCMCICIYVCIYIYVCMYVCEYIFMYIYVYIYICIYICVHTYANNTVTQESNNCKTHFSTTRKL
jgi:hypothetical protein